MNETRLFYRPPNVRAQVKGVDVADICVRRGDGSGGVAEVRCLHPTNVAHAGRFGPDELRDAKAPILREEKVPVAFHIRERREWISKYQGRATRRFGDRTHSFKGGNLSAGVVLTDFEPPLPGHIFGRADRAEVA